jgi:hypothetical protein
MPKITEHNPVTLGIGTMFTCNCSSLAAKSSRLPRSFLFMTGNDSSRLQRANHIWLAGWKKSCISNMTIQLTTQKANPIKDSYNVARVSSGNRI